jgi:hypothetical protein
MPDQEGAEMIKTVKLAHEMEIVLVDCFNCGTVFGINDNLHRRFRERGDTFYCPNGHSQAYTKSLVEVEKEKAKKEVERLQWELQSKNNRIMFTENQLRATKGAVTKLKKRIANGACPCCKRQFVNLHRHMESQHPDYVEPKSDAERAN